MRHLLFLILFLTLFCPLASVAECQPGAVEPFERFIAVFARDKAFAATRTRYPLPVRRHETGYEDGKVVDELVDTVLSKADDAAALAMGIFARENGLQLTTSSVQKTRATVRMEKPGTDWLLTYHFRRNGSCWYLQRIEDHSL